MRSSFVSHPTKSFDRKENLHSVLSKIFIRTWKIRRELNGDTIWIY